MEDYASVKKEIFYHFKLQFTEQQVIRPHFRSEKFKVLSSDHILTLEAEISEDEIKHAIWSCEGSKAPGPNGFNMNFVKKNWEILKSDIVAAIKYFQRSGCLPHGCNSAFIDLIPKGADPHLVTDYMPISLVNLPYKILSKVLAHRLKNVIPFIISDSQTAFIEGRQILDGILVANEIVAWAKKSKTKLMMFKIDFAKAFDC